MLLFPFNTRQGGKSMPPNLLPHMRPRNFTTAIALALASFAVHANPVAWTAPGGNLSGQYCYDFGDYVPAADTPVVGGFVKIGGGSAWVYGVVCTGQPYGGVGDPYGWPRGWYGRWFSDYFWKDSRAPAGGIYFSTQSSTTCTNPDGFCSTYYLGPSFSCPKNTAMISVPGYKRSDGVELHPPLNYYSFYHGYYAGPSLPAGRGGYVSPDAERSHTVCVKTDTAQ